MLRKMLRSEDLPSNEPGVLYEQKGKLAKLYLSSFAQWAKRPECDSPCDSPWHQNPGLINDCPSCGASG